MSKKIQIINTIIVGTFLIFNSVTIFLNVIFSLNNFSFKELFFPENLIPFIFWVISLFYFIYIIRSIKNYNPINKFFKFAFYLNIIQILLNIVVFEIISLLSINFLSKTIMSRELIFLNHHFIYFISFIIFIIGYLKDNNKSIIKPLIFGGTLLIVLFLISSNITSLLEKKLNPQGFCVPKEQFDCGHYDTSDNCFNAPDYLMCQWRDSNKECVKAACYNIEDETKCRSYSEELNCIWEDNFCQTAKCTAFMNEVDCKSYSSSSLNCGWGNDNSDLEKFCEFDKYREGCDSLNYNCRETFCKDFKNESSCSSNSLNKDCIWSVNHCENDYSNENEYYQNDKLQIIINECIGNRVEDSCVSNSNCKWNPPLLCSKRGNCVSF